MADNDSQKQMKVESNVDKVKAKAKEVAYVYPSFIGMQSSVEWSYV